MTTYAKLSLVMVPLLMVACTEPAPPPIQQEAPLAPTVKRFTASPTELVPGEKATLSWETENATSISIEQIGAGAVPGVSSTKTTGELQVTIEGDALFLLTAHGAGGVDQQSAAVYTSGSASAVLFSVVPARIISGETATLVWSAPGAASVTIEDENGNPVGPAGTVPTNGAFIVQPSVTTRYVIRAGNRTASTEVNVAATIHEFVATGAPYIPGGSATLHWRTGGATAVTLEAAGRGVIFTSTTAGEVNEGSFEDNLPAALPLNSLVNYTLTIEQGGRTFSRPLQINIGVDPTIDDFTAPVYAKRGVGAGVDLAWQTSGAEAIDVFIDDAHVFRSTDTQVIRNGELKEYQPAASKDQLSVRIEATNSRGGFASETAVVDIVSAPVFDTVAGFVATPGSVTGGQPITLSWNVLDARKLVIKDSAGTVVVSRTGVESETGTVVVYANATQTYTAFADNTLGDSAEQSVTVNVTPIHLKGAGNGVVVKGGTVSVGAPDELPGLTEVFRASSTFTRSSPSGFVDISSTGARLTLLPTSIWGGEDEGLATFSAGFTTTLFGQTLTASNVAVSSNGWLSFSPATSSQLGGYIGSTSAYDYTIAPFWEDLLLDSADSVFWEVATVNGSPKLIVQWNGAEVYLETTRLDFQVQLGADGTVVFAYRNLTGTGGDISVGIQGVDATEIIIATEELGAPDGVENDVRFFFGTESIPLPFDLTATAKGPYTYKVMFGENEMAIDYTVPVFVEPGDLVLSEALYHPAAPLAATGEWVELYNRSAQAIDLEGFTFAVDATTRTTLVPAQGTTVIPPGGILLLAQSADPLENGGITPDLVYGPGLAMSDTGSYLVLAKGVEAAGLGYSQPFGNQGGEGISVVLDYGPFLIPAATAFSTQTCEPDVATVFPVGGTTTQRGSPGTIKACSTYAVRPIAPGFTDISATGAVLFAGIPVDNQTATLDLALPFPFFGAFPPASTVLNIGLNGYFTVDSAQTIPGTYTMSESAPLTTAPNSLVGVFGDDLVAKAGDPASNVFTQRFNLGEDPNAMDPHWTIQWNRLTPDLSDPEDTLTFQAKLFDNGRIEIHYGEMIDEDSGSDYATGKSANVWVENAAGDLAVVLHSLSLGPSAIVGNTSFEFAPVGK